MSDITPVPQHFFRTEGTSYSSGTIPLGDWSEDDFAVRDESFSVEQFVEGAERYVNWSGIGDPAPKSVRRAGRKKNSVRKMKVDDVEV